MAKDFTNSLNSELNKKPTDSLENSQDNKLVFDIPHKARQKDDTQAFNVVMDKLLVRKLDQIAKKKGGYSRNELINIVCKIFIDNFED